ncbi:nuclear pore complex protein Nup85 [Bacillus rossius redtenbacheri]|uniref:nuclear pore complex protein Nup85 n=1 Tax=Bacillus rossius redtenbacheri TaxID=93214 RepID=UPI002FDDD7BE
MGTVKRSVNPDAEESGSVAAVWGSFETLGIFQHKHIVAGCSDVVGSQFESNDLVQLQPRVVLFDRTVRKLINESNGTFLEGQKLMKSVSVVDSRVEVWKLSTMYRAIMHECLENLQKEAAQESDERQESCCQLVTIFYNIQFLWHLLEIMHFAVVPGSQVLPPLLDWLRFHMCEAEQRAASLLEAAQRDQDWGGGESQPQFWATVVGLVLQGRSDTARCLLRTHSLAGSRPFQQADYVLRTWPLLNAERSAAQADISDSRAVWRRETLHKLHTGAFSSVAELELVVQIMCGEEQAFVLTKQYCETWYQHMAAWLLYTAPMVKTFELLSHAGRSIALYGGAARLTTVDRALIAIMESDFTEVVKIAATLENGWFATHLTDLLCHSGLLQSDDPANTKLWTELHEGLLLQYGSMLMGHTSLWPVGASYLDHCPSRGLQRLALLLPRLPLHSELRAQRVLEAARSRGLPTVVAGVCRVMARRSYEQQRPGNALAWALRCQDQDLVSFLADWLLQDFLENNHFQCLDLLETLGCPSVLSDRLTFLVKYCEFRRIFAEGRNEDAAALLVHLLDSRLAPKFFWGRLISDVLPLLRCVVLSPEQTLAVLRVMEETESADEAVLQEVRAALNRNLGRAHVQQFTAREEGERIYI